MRYHVRSVFEVARVQRLHLRMIFVSACGVSNSVRDPLHQRGGVQ
jgi:hypothetical protein